MFPEQVISLVNSMTSAMAFMAAIAGAYLFFRFFRETKEREFLLQRERDQREADRLEGERERQRERDQFEQEMREREYYSQRETRDKQAELERQSAEEKEISRGGGYIFFDISDEYKPIFHDAISGFKEYAKLKGYNVSLGVDTSLPGKVGIKIVIEDSGVTVSTATVRKDVDEYIRKIQEDEEEFSHLPIVADRMEHDRLVAAIKMRFSFLKHQAALHAATADAYKRMLQGVERFATRGISYSQASTDQIANPYRRNEAVRSLSVAAPAGVGKAQFRGDALRIGASSDEQRRLSDAFGELVELLRLSDIANKVDAIRYLENVREELDSNSDLELSQIAKWLGRAKDMLETAAAGSELYEKAKAAFNAVGFRF